MNEKVEQFLQSKKLIEKKKISDYLTRNGIYNTIYAPFEIVCHGHTGNKTLNFTVKSSTNVKVGDEILVKSLGFDKEDLRDRIKTDDLRQKLKTVDVTKMAKELEIGEMTLKDIIEELSKPGRDPREDMPKPILRQDVLKLEDLQEGMILTGTVRNVIDFGAFVDIGVKYDGLVHISEMSDKFIKNPSDLVSVGDIVKVKVIKIDRERKKVGLSMKV